MQINTIIFTLLFVKAAASFAGTTHEFGFDFSEDDHGWEVGFSDYGQAMEESMELDSGHQTRPDDPTKKALYITGNNRSDDLFMYFKKEVRLKPRQLYRVRMSVSFLSSVPAGLIGIGGAPAESLYVKAGAMIAEPTSEVQPNGYYRMSIDKGNQASEGVDTDNLGDIANSGTFDFELVERNNGNLPSFWVETDDSGMVWLLMGTDSGFEGATELYYTNVEFVFEPLSLCIERAGSQIRLSWPTGVLQESDDLMNWFDLDTAKSPLLVTPSQGRKFWKVRPDGK